MSLQTMSRSTVSAVLMGVATATALASTTIAQAQPSTSGLWPNNPLVVDIAAGPELAFLTGGLGGSDGTEGSAFGVMAAVRGRLASHVYLGATGWHIERRQQRRVELNGAHVTDRLSSIGVEAMLGLPIYKRTRLSATGGVGTAFSVSSTRPRPGAISGSGSGTVLMVGATLEIGRLQLSQKAVILLGAEDVIVESREYYPVTIGWRF